MLLDLVDLCFFRLVILSLVHLLICWSWAPLQGNTYNTSPKLIGPLILHCTYTSPKLKKDHWSPSAPSFFLSTQHPSTPSTQHPAPQHPSTPAPAPAPSTSTPAPSTQHPSTQHPSTPTPAPSTPAPSTPAPRHPSTQHPAPQHPSTLAQLSRSLLFLLSQFPFCFPSSTQAPAPSTPAPQHSSTAFPFPSFSPFSVPFLLSIQHPASQHPASQHPPFQNLIFNILYNYWRQHSICFLTMAVEIKWQHVTTDFISWRLYGMDKSVGAPPKFTNWMLQTVKTHCFYFLILNLVPILPTPRKQ